MGDDVLGSATRPCIVLIVESLRGIAKITEQVPPVRDLDSIGRALTSAVSIGASTVPGDDLNPGPTAQALGNCCCFPVKQQIDHLILLQVPQHRAVAVPALPGPIIDSQHPESRWRCLNG